MTDELQIEIKLGRASFSATGAPQQVMNALERFSELASQPDLAIDADDAEDIQGDPAAVVAPVKPAEREPLPVFLNNHTLKGNIESATAIVAWAQKHDGKTHGLKNGEIAAYWRSTKLKEPGNLTRDLGSAVKAGMLHREGGTYTVTGFGKKTIGLTD